MPTRVHYKENNTRQPVKLDDNFLFCIWYVKLCIAEFMVSTNFVHENMIWWHINSKRIKKKIVSKCKNDNILITSLVLCMVFTTENWIVMEKSVTWSVKWIRLICCQNIKTKNLLHDGYGVVEVFSGAHTIFTLHQ